MDKVLYISWMFIGKEEKCKYIWITKGGITVAKEVTLQVRIDE